MAPHIKSIRLTGSPHCETQADTKGTCFRGMERRTPCARPTPAKLDGNVCYSNSFFRIPGLSIGCSTTGYEHPDMPGKIAPLCVNAESRIREDRSHILRLTRADFNHGTPARQQ